MSDTNAHLITVGGSVLAVASSTSKANDWLLARYENVTLAKGNTQRALCFNVTRKSDGKRFFASIKKNPLPFIQ